MLHIDQITLEFDSEEHIDKGQTAGKNSSFGSSFNYMLQGDDDLSGILSYVEWANGERDVRVKEIHGPQQLLQLNSGRLRLSIHHAEDKGYPQVGFDMVTLRLAKIDPSAPNNWAKLKNANIEDVRNATACDPGQVLSAHGIIAFGSKSSVLQETGISKNQLCAVFPSGNRMVPLIAFCITRIISITNLFKG